MNSINPAPEFWDSYLSASTGPSNVDYNSPNALNVSPSPIHYKNGQQQQQQQFQQQIPQDFHLHNPHIQHQQHVENDRYLTPPSLSSGDHAKVPCDLLGDDIIANNSPSQLYTSNVAQLDTRNSISKFDDCDKYLNDQNQELINQQHPSKLTNKKRQRTDGSVSNNSNENSEIKLSPSDSSFSDISSNQNSSNNNLNNNNNNNNSNGNILHLTEEEIIERKKAQNRAAQRAFRERKEGKLKELDAKLSQSLNENHELMKQLEQLKQQNIILNMENEMLQRNGSSKKDSSSDASTVTGKDHKKLSLNSKNNNSNNGANNNYDQNGNNDKYNNNNDINTNNNETNTNTNNQNNNEDAEMMDEDPKISEQKFTFPISREAFITKVTEDHAEAFFTPVQDLKSLSYETDGEEVLTVSAVWDYLNSLLSEYDELDFDIPQIMLELKGNERCHGYGPAYPLQKVHEVIKKNVG